MTLTGTTAEICIDKMRRKKIIIGMEHEEGGE